MIVRLVGTVGLVALLACQSATPPSVIGPSGSAPDGSPALATAGDPVETPPPFDYSRTSQALIAAALAAGKIDYHTSLLFRVYAAFGSAELPAEYRSDFVDLHAATFAFAEVAEHEPELSADIKAALAPYLARPSDPGSVFNRQQPVAALGLSAAGQEWVSAPAAGGKARVWLAKDKADRLGEFAAEVDRVWPTAFTLTREPIPDTAGEPLATVNPDNAIDIYFAEVGVIDPRVFKCRLDPTRTDCDKARKDQGYTQTAQPYKGDTSSAHVVIDAGMAGLARTASVAHELVHTSQYSYDFTEGAWLKDSTAEWGAFRTMKLLGLDADPEYEYLARFFAELNDPLSRNLNDSDLHRYGSWLYYLSLQIDKGDQLLKPIFEQMSPAGQQNAGAVDAAYPFADNFGRFAVSNWNRDAAMRYRTGDPMFPGNYWPSEIHASTLGPGEHQPPFATGYLSADYAHYTFTDDVRQVVFDNNLSGTVTACNCIPSVWLIAKTQGSWKEPQEIVGSREYCFARPDQDLDELVVVVANTGWQQGDPLTTDMMPTITASDEECELGDAFGTITWTLSDEYSNPDVPEVDNQQEQVTVNVKLAANSDGWEDDGSTFSWSGEGHSRSEGQCPSYSDDSWQGSGSFAANENAYISFGMDDQGDGTPATASLVAVVQGELHGHHHQEAYFDNLGRCVVSADGDYSQGGHEWVQQPYCENAGDGLIGKPSDDGSTYDFACSFTDSGPQNTNGSFRTMINVSGTITILKRPGD